MSGHLSTSEVLHAAARRKFPVRDRDQGLRPVARGMVCTRAEFLQPRRFNWARYEGAVRALHDKIMVIGTLVSSVTLITLNWKVAEGEAVSPGRWLLGAGAGWFVIGMLRLALFVFLSAPQIIRFGRGRIWLSGIGVVHPTQIVGWSVRPVRKKRRQPPCVQVEIRCRRWHGWERRWILCLEDGWQASELHHLLQAACPRMEYLHLPGAAGAGEPASLPSRALA